MPILVFIQGGSLLGQSHKNPEHYFSLYTKTGSPQSPGLTSEFLKFSRKLENRRASKDDKHFLKYVFEKTHQHYLRQYESYASFNELTDKGVYNCLTGTALYALILDHLGFKYKIIETNYHIFLVVNTADGMILFEATDPIKGFVADADKVERRLRKYKENQMTHVDPQKNYYEYSFRLFDEVNLDQMLGLLYYNEAIEAFNAQQLPSAVNHLDKAIGLYKSPRIEEFTKIILMAVSQSTMEASVKESCVRKIQSIRRQKMHVIANSSLEDKR
jgi:hypothetical protein